MKAGDLPVSFCGKVSLVIEIICIPRIKKLAHKTYKGGRHKSKGKSDLAIKKIFFGRWVMVHSKVI